MREKEEERRWREEEEGRKEGRREEGGGRRRKEEEGRKEGRKEGKEGKEGRREEDERVCHSPRLHGTRIAAVLEIVAPFRGQRDTDPRGERLDESESVELVALELLPGKEGDRSRHHADAQLQPPSAPPRRPARPPALFQVRAGVAAGGPVGGETPGRNLLPAASAGHSHIARESRTAPLSGASRATSCARKPGALQGVGASRDSAVLQVPPRRTVNERSCLLDGRAGYAA